MNLDVVRREARGIRRMGSEEISRLTPHPLPLLYPIRNKTQIQN